MLCILENVGSFLDIPKQNTGSDCICCGVTGGDKTAIQRRVIQACNLIVAHVNLTNGLAWCADDASLK